MALSTSKAGHSAWAQQAALTAAALVAYIQKHAAGRTTALSITSSQLGMAATAQLPAPLGPPCAAHAAAAVLKCLPYELPSTAGAFARLSGLSRTVAALGRPAALEQAQADLYGASVEAGTTSRPLMSFGRPAVQQPVSLMSAASAETCTAISGAPPSVHCSHTRSLPV